MTPASGPHEPARAAGSRSGSDPIRLRETLRAIPAYVPGRAVQDAVRLASNESPYPPLPFVVQRIAQVAAEANRYPDTSCDELRTALGQRFGWPAELIRVGCGSVSLCSQLAQAAAGPGDEIVFAWRSFEMYPIVAAVTGATAVRVPLRDEVHDLKAMAAAVTDRTRVVFVCNPNNPTGTAVTKDDVHQLLLSIPSDVLVVVDEAYYEYVTDDRVSSALDFLDEFRNLVVLRTFSKAYGLAGLRVGYALVGGSDIAEALSKVQVPFTVTSVASAAALASLEAPAQQQMVERVKENARERARVTERLNRFGYKCLPSHGNFIWLPLGSDTNRWTAHMESHGVAVRPFVDGARVTVGSESENDRLLAAAGQFPSLPRSSAL